MNAMDLSGIVASMPNQAITITRTAGGTWTKGLYSGGAATTLTGNAIVYPAGNRDLLLLPEGLRTRETIVVIWDAELRTANEATGTQADRIAYDSKTWEVQAVQAWLANAGFCQALATKVDA